MQRLKGLYGLSRKLNQLRPERDFEGQCRVRVSYVREGLGYQQSCLDKCDTEHDLEVKGQQNARMAGRQQWLAGLPILRSWEGRGAVLLW